MRRIWLIVVCVVMVVLPEISQARPVVLSLSEVGDFTTESRHQVGMTLRPQIVSQLVHDYDCVVLSRSNSECLSTEAHIVRFKAIADPKSEIGMPLAADYAVRVHIRRGGSAANVKVFVIIKDIREDVEREDMRVVFDVPATVIGGGNVREYGNVRSSIVKKIAKALFLKRRVTAARESEGNDKRKYVWAVLPFARLDAAPVRKPLSGKDIINLEYDTRSDALQEVFQWRKDWWGNKFNFRERVSIEDGRKRLAEMLRASSATMLVEDDYALANSVEIEVSRSSEVAGLVDRSSLKAVLQELKLSTVVGVNECVAGQIARLVGAERLVMGFVIKEGSKYRVVLHLVDAKTGVVLNASERSCATETEMADLIASIGLDFVNAAVTAPALAKSPAWQRRKEADFFIQEGWRMHSQSASYMAARLNRVEIAYLLMHNNQDYLKRNIVPLLVKVAKESIQYDIVIAARSASLMEYILREGSSSESVRAPLLMVADAYLRVHDYENALRLMNAHVSAFPEAYIPWSMYIDAACSYYKGDVRKALSLSQSALDLFDQKGSKRRSSGDWFEQVERKVSWILIRAAQDESVCDEKVELSALNRWFVSAGDADYRFETFYVLRLIQLTRKLVGIEEAIVVAGRTPHMFEANMARASYLTELGRFDAAAAVYKDLFGGRKLRGVYLQISQSMLSKLEKRSENRYLEEKVALKKTAEILSIPKKYSIYCFPVDGVDTNVMRLVNEKLAKMIGCDVTVMETLPQPVGSFNDKNEFHNFYSFSRQLLQSANIPDDALFAYFVTGEPIVPHASSHVAYNYSAPYYGNPVVSSHYGMERFTKYPSDTVVSLRMSGSLHRAFVSCILEPLPLTYLGWNHTLDGCDSDGCDGAGLQLCPDCAEKYSYENIDKCHRALHSFLKWEFKQLVTGYMGKP